MLKIAYIYPKNDLEEKISIKNFKIYFDPKGGPFASGKKWIFFENFLSFIMLQNDIKRYFRAKKVKNFFEIF